MRGRLAVRLALIYGLISTMVITIMGLSIFLLTAHYLRDREESNLEALADFYAAYATTTASDETRLAALAPQIASFFAQQANYDVRLFSGHSGALLAATRDIGSLPSSISLAQLGGRRPTLFLAGSYDDPNRLYAARPVRTAEGTLLAVIEVSRATVALEAFLGVLRLVLFGAGGLALAAALIASILVARQITNPLRQMEATTRAIASGDFDQRLSVTSVDEIGRLAASINWMASDLARLEAARRDFLAKVSHDLRTPLTAIKGFVVNLQDTAPHEMQAPLATVDEQTDRLVRLVNDLLTASRLQRGELSLHFAQVDLAAVARSATATVSERTRRMGIALNLELPEKLPPLEGDADRLEQVLVNLLDNAIRATPAGGTIRIHLRSSASEVLLTIIDNGRGLTEEEEAHAFEPYFHGPGGGTGLGLAIAREIVEAHGGRIWLRDRSEGGAEAGIGLPRS